jgi:hypothetical protein
MIAIPTEEEPEVCAICDGEIEEDADRAWSPIFDGPVHVECWNLWRES